MEDDAQWVQVEKYLAGTVHGDGAATGDSIHLRVDGAKGLLAIDASQCRQKRRGECLAHQRVLVRVSARQHLVTGALRSLRLISFEDYSQAYDEAAIERFAEAGRLAWADVPDAAAWVREQRGGE